MKSKTIQPWDELVKNPSESYREFFEIEKEFLIGKTNSNCIFLEIGSGTGRTLKIISPLVKKVYGIDNDEEAVKNSRANLKELSNVEILLEDAEKTSFQDKYFDIVFTNSFHNFAETKNIILHEINRILKDDGKLILSIYNEQALEERLKMYNQYSPYIIKDKKRGIVIMKSTGAISEQFSKEEIEKILNENGFKIVDLDKGKIFYIIEACRNN